MDKGRMWTSGTTLRVQLLGGSPLVRKKVEEYSQKWSEHANLRISFPTSGPTDIRVGFEEGAGSWSYIGTACDKVDPNEPTMNFGWFSDKTSEEDFAQTILHEFGHALGCIHEHQSPSAGILWNKPVVYEYYEQEYKWEKAKVDKNIFQAYDKNITQFSSFDETSIMNYPIPVQLTTNEYSTTWNNELSEADKSFIAGAYPPSSNLIDDRESDNGKSILSLLSLSLRSDSDSHSNIKRAKKSKERSGRNQKEGSKRKEESCRRRTN